MLYTGALFSHPIFWRSCFTFFLCGSLLFTYTLAKSFYVAIHELFGGVAIRLLTGSLPGFLNCVFRSGPDFFTLAEVQHYYTG
jgi:hypothetical protein